jgi:hypothetical protein
MRTRIISAFPGCGKSNYHNKYPKTTLDSDSSQFSWIEKDGIRIRNPEFPKNYIEHIRENIGKYEFIFVSSHKEVRDALLSECIFFYLIYPNDVDKDVYIKRYQERGSDDKFIELISNNWSKWLRELDFCEVGCKRIRMVSSIHSDWYLENEIRHIIASEHGDVLDE